MMGERESVVVGVSGDSGPYVWYWRAADTENPRPSPPGCDGFGTAYFAAPRALWDEYEAIEKRKMEIENEFGRMATRHSVGAG